MARCEVCGKGTSVGRRISINRSQVSRRAKRTVKANVQKVKVMLNGNPTRVNICTKCLRAGLLDRA